MPIPWNVLASRILYADNWIRLRSDTCRTADGIVVEGYHVLEYPAWANVVALTDEGEIVLVHQYRHAVGEVVLELPGGSVDAGEEPIVGAARELEEETGYTAAALVPLGAWHANPASHDNRVHAFLAVGARPDGVTARDPLEDLEVVTRDFAAYARDVIAGREPLQMMHLAALHQALHAVAASADPALAPLRARIAREVFAPLAG